MQKCHSCGRPFGWRKIYKAFLGWVYKPIECDHCGAKHKMTMQGRFILVSLTALPSLLFIIYFSPFTNSFASLSVGLVILAIGSLLIPYFVKFKVA